MQFERQDADHFGTNEWTTGTPISILDLTSETPADRLQAVLH